MILTLSLTEVERFSSYSRRLHGSHLDCEVETPIPTSIARTGLNEQAARTMTKTRVHDIFLSDTSSGHSYLCMTCLEGEFELFVLATELVDYGVKKSNMRNFNWKS